MCQLIPRLARIDSVLELPFRVQQSPMHEHYRPKKVSLPCSPGFLLSNLSPPKVLLADLQNNQLVSLFLVIARKTLDPKEGCNHKLDNALECVSQFRAESISRLSEIWRSVEFQ